jgi:hypothetical protein
MDREAYLKNAADCREKAKSDPAHADYWTDEAIIWLQRATETGGDRAITYELRDGRMIPKLGQ